MNTFKTNELNLIEQQELPLFPQETRCFRCPCNSESRECAFTCHAKPSLLARRIREVDGLRGDWPLLTSSRTIQYEHYVPLLEPGRCYPDLSALNTVAVTLYDLFAVTKDKTSCIPKFRTPAELRSALRCRSDCRVIVSGVEEDWRLELFWKHLEKDRLAVSLAELNVDVVTIPNFSFFIPMPEEHALYNIRRMQIVASCFVDAGLRVVPHLNATTEEHWDIWTNFLSAQPQVTHICTEFQTGNKNRKMAEDTVYHLLKLQEDIGRQLSLVIIAGRQHIDLLRQRFQNICLIDSQVMIKSAFSRKVILRPDGRLEWEKTLVSNGHPLTRLFYDNYTCYSSIIEQLSASDPIPMQMRFSLSRSGKEPLVASHAA